MALVQSLLNPMLARYTRNLDKYENRGSKYAAWDAFVDDTNSIDSILSPEVKQMIENSFGRQGGVQIPVIDNEDVTIGSVRSCTIGDDENTSQMYTLTFVTYVWGFTMYPNQHEHQLVGYEADFMAKMKKYMNKLFQTWETACVAQLEADKNQHYTTDITNIYPTLADALRVPQAGKNDMYNQVGVIRDLQDFYPDSTRVIAGSTHRSLVNRYRAQGPGNDENDAFQFDDAFRWYFTNRIQNGAGVQSTAFVVPEGTLAVYNRNTPVARKRQSSTDGRQWEEVQIPFRGPDGNAMRVGSQYFSTCADAQAALGTTLGGITEADLKELFIFDTEICYLTAYNSDRANSFSAIQKYEVLTS